jgi:CO/xanthine dehydrogenase FAD-binding subunit
MMTGDRIDSRERDVWSIEADASLQAVLDSSGCPALLRQTLSRDLVWQDRNRRIVRRAVASPNVAPQWSAALLALGATVSIEQEGEKVEMQMARLLAERPKGQILALHVRSGAVRWGSAHVARTPADKPIVAAFAGIELDGDLVSQARLALMGVWPTAIGMAQAAGKLLGEPLDAEAIEAVAAQVQEEVAPQGDFLGSEPYRRAMAGVLTRRALEQCLTLGTRPTQGGSND